MSPPEGGCFVRRRTHENQLIVHWAIIPNKENKADAVQYSNLTDFAAKIEQAVQVDELREQHFPGNYTTPVYSGRGLPEYRRPKA